MNRKARGGENDLQPAIDVLTGAFGPPLTLDFDAPGPMLERLDAACAESLERVVVAGGDGTVSAAAELLVRNRKPVGILPIGTANDFARTLGIPVDLDEAAEIIIRGKTRRVDVGVVNGRCFLNAAGIGFSTNLHKELPPWAKRTLGPLAYPFGVAKRWRRHRPFSVDIVGSGARLRLRAIQVTVANGRFYGGGMVAEQDAEIDDGRLDLIVVLPSPWWRHVSSVVGLRRGVYPERAPVVVERRTSFEVQTRRPHEIAADGEPATATPASFDVLPRALEVFAP